jgi:hypothetical protein
MKMKRSILAGAVTLVLFAGLSISTVSQTKEAGQNAGASQAQSPTLVTTCKCGPKTPLQPNHPLAGHKPPPCDYSCDCEKQKTTCLLSQAQDEAEREANLGQFYLRTQQYEEAFRICEAALNRAGSSPSARSCEQMAMTSLQNERKSKLGVRLEVVDARLLRGEADEAIGELERIRSELAPDHSPLGEFDQQMNAELEARLNRAKRIKWLTWFLAALPILFWTILKILALLAAALLLPKLYFYARDQYQRHQRYRTRKLESETIEWTMWSIRDVDNQGGGGPVMDALNPNNNPLLKGPLKPSSLLLVPLLAVEDATNGGDDKESPVWRDFLDAPRAAIDMEELPPLSEFQKHRFNQIEAFDEFDVKVGSVEAKGVVGLLRTLRKWLDSGLPAAQGIVYSAKGESDDKQTYACVRITCNWTTKMQELPSEQQSLTNEGPRSEEGIPLEPSSAADETLSVYASSAHHAAIDAVALSAQRAAFKLFHRLLTKSSPTYATAVANFHQGVRLIDEYI